MISVDDIKRVALFHVPYDETAPFSYAVSREDDIGTINTSDKGCLWIEPLPTKLIAPCIYCSKDIDVTDKIPEIIEQFNELLADGQENDSNRKRFEVTCENKHCFELGIEIQI